MKIGDFARIKSRQPPDTLDRIVSIFNRTASDYPRNGTTHGQFSIQARKTPEAVAIADEQREYTFRELDTASSQLAQSLLSRGLEPESIVGTMLDDTFCVIATLLGIMKAGGAYMPIDRKLPRDRIKHLLRGSRFLISDEKHATELGETGAVPAGVEMLTFGGRDYDTSRQPIALPERSSPDGLAYIMYTSGTTGHPKGVMVPHRAILRLVLNTNYLEPAAAQRILQTGALSFDASTFEIWGALLNGGCLCHPPEHGILDAVDLKALIRKYGATAMWLTAGLFNQLVEADAEIFERLQLLLIGGEKLSIYHVNRVKAALPGLSLINGYGPTENTTFTCFHRIDEAQNHDIPIGRPIANTQVFILSATRSLVAVGVAGEICAGGDGLARGYMNDPATTAEKFVPHPLEPGNRLYRTGDWGRWRADGTIEFLGRKDQQIKLRGYRIEPGEIEARLTEHPDVREAVVLGKDLGTSTAMLVAYVTGPEDLDADDLRSHLCSVLPEYMVPGMILRIEQMPLTGNGKVDRNALSLPDHIHAVGRRSIVAPTTNTEKRVLDIWKTVVHQERIGVTDDFFTAGGHSLAVTTLITSIQKEFDIVLPQSLIFKPATVRDVVQYILEFTEFGVEGIDEAVVPLSGKCDGRNIFAFPPGTGDALGYIQLAALMKPYAMYAFNFLAVETRLADYADLIIGIDSAGPYVLFGYSVGGNLAFHVARELESRGKKVSDIVMVDSWRYRRKVQFPEGEVDRVTAAFLNHESVAPYLSNPVLREKAYRLIERYYRYLENTVDVHHIAANIHVLQSDVQVQPFLDSSGEEALSMQGWAEVTSGQFRIYQGKGEHRVMLNAPHLESNAHILLAMFNALDWNPVAMQQGARQ